MADTREACRAVSWDPWRVWQDEKLAGTCLALALRPIVSICVGDRDGARVPSLHGRLKVKPNCLHCSFRRRL